MEPDTPGQPSTPGMATGYGRACQACFKAKCRCVQRPGASGRGCERCYRLKRECQPSDSIRKRNAKSVLARTAQLENKLDGLVNLLQNVAQGQTGTQVPSQASSSHDTSSPESFNRPLPNHSHETPSSNIITTPISHPTGGSSSTFDHGGGFVFDPSPEEAEASLAYFRDHMLRFYPILDLPTSLTARQLRADRPFLFECIFAVTSRSTARRVTLGRDIKRRLGQLFVAENATSMDLLQGVLAYTAYAHDHFVLKTPSLSRLTHLSMSLVFDMYLNKPRPTAEHELPKMADTEHMKAPSAWFAERTLEQRRAVLGCFLLSSATAWKFTQIDPLVWTPYMDECVRIIGENDDCAGDRSLAVQCRLQRIIQKSSAVAWPTSEQGSVGQIPPSVYITALDAELEQVKASLSPDLQNNEIISAAIHFTALTIHEGALNKRIAIPLTASAPGFERLGHLSTCLASVKAWLDVFFQRMSATVFASLTFQLYAQLISVIFALLKLSTLDDPAWDRQMVRNTVDLLALLDRIIADLDGLSAAWGEGSEDMVAQCARMFKAIRAGAGTELESGGQMMEGRQPVGTFAVEGSSGLGGSAGPGPGTGPGMDQAGVEQALEAMFADETWMRDIFGFPNLGTLGFGGMPFADG